MKRYKFCSQQSEEAIGYCLADSNSSALKVFSRMKKLSIEEFSKLYKILDA